METSDHAGGRARTPGRLSALVLNSVPPGEPLTSLRFTATYKTPLFGFQTFQIRESVTLDVFVGYVFTQRSLRCVPRGRYGDAFANSERDDAAIQCGIRSDTLESVTQEKAREAISTPRAPCYLQTP